MQEYIYQVQDCSEIKAVLILIEVRIPRVIQWGRQQRGFNTLGVMKKIKIIVDFTGLKRFGGDIIQDYTHLQTLPQVGIFIVEQKEVEACIAVVELQMVDIMTNLPQDCSSHCLPAKRFLWAELEDNQDYCKWLHLLVRFIVLNLACKTLRTSEFLKDFSFHCCI